MAGTGEKQSQRTTFRPPWVKEVLSSVPKPTNNWSLQSRKESQIPKTDSSLSKKSTQIESKEINSKISDNNVTFGSDNSKTTLIPSSKTISNKYDNSFQKTLLTKKDTECDQRQISKVKHQLERQVNMDIQKFKDETIIPKNDNVSDVSTLLKSASRANIPAPPRPPPPPPPISSREVLMNLPPLTDKQQKTLEMLKSRPRKRPDWACMMKDIEIGKKLRHVSCNDRSAPLIETVITKISADKTGNAHFVFDSEKSNVHNKLLKQIQEGVKLKSVKTNDRSKPVLEGLKKFRRQLTIEEQIQKAEQLPIDEVLPDEMDDIDAVRDDLQSTKQMLELELKNKEYLEKENKELKIKILDLEMQLQKKQLVEHNQKNESNTAIITNTLKKDLEQAKIVTKILEKDLKQADNEKNKLKSELEEINKQYINLEKRMKTGMALAGCPNSNDIAKLAIQKSIEKIEQESFDSEFSDPSDEESDENQNQKTAEEKRQYKEIKLLIAKIKNFKDKTIHSKKERKVLKDQIKLQQKLLNEEKKKFRVLQQEVDKMAKLVTDSEVDDNDYEEQAITEPEEESESEESEDDDDDNELEIDDCSQSFELRKEHLQIYLKNIEVRLNVLKKGNYLLKVQIDKLKNDVEIQKEESAHLKDDLDSVLAELG